MQGNSLPRKAINSPRSLQLILHKKVPLSWDLIVMKSIYDWKLNNNPSPSYITSPSSFTGSFFSILCFKDRFFANFEILCKHWHCIHCISFWVFFKIICGVEWRCGILKCVISDNFIALVCLLCCKLCAPHLFVWSFQWKVCICLLKCVHMASNV